MLLNVGESVCAAVPAVTVSAVREAPPGEWAQARLGQAIEGAVGQAITPATVYNGGVVRRTHDWLPGEGLRPQHLKRKKGAHMGAWADLLARGGRRTGLP